MLEEKQPDYTVSSALNAIILPLRCSSCRDEQQKGDIKKKSILMNFLILGLAIVHRGFL